MNKTFISGSMSTWILPFLMLLLTGSALLWAPPSSHAREVADRSAHIQSLQKFATRLEALMNADKLNEYFKDEAKPYLGVVREQIQKHTEEAKAGTPWDGTERRKDITLGKIIEIHIEEWERIAGISVPARVFDLGPGTACERLKKILALQEKGVVSQEEIQRLKAGLPENAAAHCPEVSGSFQKPLQSVPSAKVQSSGKNGVGSAKKAQ